MSKSGPTVSIPKSMRHKRILDVAAENPDASMEELADTVPSATADLVENVLEEYGDPADNTSTDNPTANPPETPPTETAPPDTPEYPDVGALSEVQRETLEAVQEHPDATQRELGERLGVSPATISNRVNVIPDFEWDARTAIVTTILDTTTTDDHTSMPSTNGTETHSASDRQAQSTSSDAPPTETQPSAESVLDDPDFAYKLLRVCMDSEEFSEADERRLFTELTQ